MEKIKAALMRHKDLVLEAERYIWKNPETGYKEYKTDAYMKEKFRGLGYELRYAENLTGFTAILDTGREGQDLHGNSRGERKGKPRTYRRCSLARKQY